MIGTCAATIDGHLAPVKSVCWIDKGKSPLSPESEPYLHIYCSFGCLFDCLCFLNKYISPYESQCMNNIVIIIISTQLMLSFTENNNNYYYQFCFPSYSNSKFRMQ